MNDFSIFDESGKMRPHVRERLTASSDAINAIALAATLPDRMAELMKDWDKDGYEWGQTIIGMFPGQLSQARQVIEALATQPDAFDRAAHRALADAERGQPPSLD